MNRIGKRIGALLVTLAMLMGLCLIPAAAEEADAGNWYDGAMSAWAERGVVKGDANGSLNPNANITRAELAVMLERIMGYQVKAENTFADVAEGDWYADAILKANAAGIIQGDGSAAHPGDSITRQEAMVMIARVLDLGSPEEGAAGFTDAGQVASWAQDAVKAMAAKGYVQGSDGMVRPADNMTRAEMVTLLNNIFAGYYDKADTYTESVEGSGVINTGDVTLSNLSVSGDLIIAEGVGSGHVVLDSVTLDGRLMIRGGGENSIIIKGDSKIDQVIVARQDGKVRVAVEGNADVSVVVVADGSDAVKVEGKVDTLTIAAPGAEVEITGTVKKVEVAEAAAGAALTVAKEAKVDTVTAAAPKAEVNVAGTVTKVETAESAAGVSVSVDKGAKVETVAVAAPETDLKVAGTVTKVDVAGTAGNATVTTEKGAKISSVTTNAAGTEIKGESGTVTKVEAGKEATGATVNVSGAKVENKSSEPVSSGTGSIEPGKSGTAASETGKPSSGSSGGGGGSSSGGGGGSDPTPAEKEKAAKDALYNEILSKVGNTSDPAEETANKIIGEYATMALTNDRVVTISISNPEKEMSAVAGDVLNWVVDTVMAYQSNEVRSMTIGGYGESIPLTDKGTATPQIIAAVKAWGDLSGSETLANVLALDKNLVMTLEGTTAGGVSYSDTYTMKFVPGNDTAFAAALDTVISAMLDEVNDTISSYASMTSEIGTVTVTVAADQGDTSLATVSNDILSKVVNYVKEYRASVDGGIAALKIGDTDIQMNSETLDMDIISAVKAWGGEEWSDYTLGGLVTLNKALDLTLTDSNDHTATYHMSFVNAAPVDEG